MKVLLVQGSAERAGAERMLLYLVRQLRASSSVEPAVLFLAEGPFVEEVRRSGVQVFVEPIKFRIREPWRWPAVAEVISEHITMFGPDVVQGNGEKTSIFATKAALSKGIPSISWLHDAPGAGGIAGSLTQRLMAHSGSTSFVTCSKWMAEAFNHRFDMGAVAITNGLDLDDLPSAKKNMFELLPEASAWDSDTVIVSHFARLQHWKGTHLFIEAAATCLEKFPFARFLVVGDALYGRELAYAAGLKSKASEAGLDGKLIFTGFRADALDLMMATDVVAHCSIQPDPFPTVILEAMVLGKAVVATMTGGAEEAIARGQTGLLVPPGDAAPLSDAISSLLQDPVGRADIGKSAREVARQRFDSKRMASEFIDLYARIVGVPEAGMMQS